MLDLLLFAGAFIGHGYLLTVGINWLFGHPIDHHLLNKLRLLSGVLVLAGLVALAAGPGWHLAERFDGLWSWSPLNLYLLACWAAAFVAVPIVTAQRLLRRPPADVLRETSVVIDFEKELGGKPLGTSKRRFFALLPGNQCFQVEFTTLELRRPGLPAAWDGLTVLQLSDLHFYDTPTRPFYEAIVRRCLADGEPDILAVTGDLVDSLQHHRWILPVLGRLRWRAAAFAILGNHDTWFETNKVRRRLRRLGMHVLGNGWKQVTVRGEPLTAIGHEGPWIRPAPDLHDCPAGGFRLLLSHTPDNIRWAQRHGVSLMLSGHNHGGQVVLPVAGSLFVPSKYGRRFDGGTFAAGPTLLHVNRGLAGKEPLRFGARPQVTRIVLRVG
jgi:uncharacterized protein